MSYLDRAFQSFSRIMSPQIGRSTPEYVLRDTFIQDSRTIELLEKLAYPTCEVCGHDTQFHFKPATDLPMPGKCISDCRCQYPAWKIRNDRLKEYLDYVFGGGME